jgi:hypothetical protein
LIYHKTFRAALWFMSRNILMLMAWVFLLALQWPFRTIADLLDKPIDAIDDKADQIMKDIGR